MEARPVGGPRPTPGRTLPRSAGGPSLRSLLLPAALVSVPLIAVALALCIRRPVIHFADDRAMIELAVRRAATGRQLIGNGTRFGWSDLGPSVFYLLVPLYLLFGQRPFALPVGLLLLDAVTVATVVAILGRRRGTAIAYAAAVAILAYLGAFGFGHFTNVWAPWEVILPLLLTVVLCAVGAADAASAWALAGAATVGSVMIQTKIEMVVVIPILLAAALVLRALYHGVPVLGRDRSPWRRPLCTLLLVVTVVVWAPPAWQQVTGHPGNLTEVARFTLRGATGRGPTGLQAGHSLSESVAALGEELSIFPIGHPSVVGAAFEHDVPTKPGWATAVAVGYGALTIAVGAIAARRRERLAACLAAMTVVAMLATCAWTMHILGPVSFFLVVWASVLPLGTWLAVAILVASLPRRRPGATIELVGAVAAALLALGLTVRHTNTLDYNRDRSGQLATLDSLIDRGPALRGLPVRVHIATAPSWPVATGVVLHLVERGAHVTVDPVWVPYFGSRFAGHHRPPPAVELWFDQPGVSDPPPDSDRLGTTKDIVLSQRVVRTPAQSAPPAPG